MQIELMRFRVKVGMAPLVDEWLAFLNENMPAVLETLEGEKMYVETIFSETLDGVECLYWYSIQGEGGKNVGGFGNFGQRINGFLYAANDGC